MVLNIFLKNIQIKYRKKIFLRKKIFKFGHELSKCSAVKNNITASHKSQSTIQCWTINNVMPFFHDLTCLDNANLHHINSRDKNIFQTSSSCTSSIQFPTLTAGLYVLVAIELSVCTIKWCNNHHCTI